MRIISENGSTAQVRRCSPLSTSICHGRSLALRAGIAILVMCLSACERGVDTPPENARAETSAGYNTGYEFGNQLAELQRQQAGIELEEVFSGMLDALSGVDPQIDAAAMRAALQAIESRVADDDSPQIPARSRGFKDDFAALNARREGVVSLPSGVQYEVEKTGSGRQPMEGDAVLINYQASLTNGTVFDTTYEDGEPLRMELDEIVVPGLKEALLLMSEGAKWRVVIPPSMGFGRSGNNQLRRRDLIYELELVSIEGAQASEP